MALVGFFDESEGPSSKAPLSVAGFLFKPDRYERLERQWRTVLRKAPGGRLPFLRMKDVYHRRKTCERRTVHQRRELLDRACDLIGCYMLAGILVQFPQEEFEEFAPPGWVSHFGSNYTAGLQAADILAWVGTHTQSGESGEDPEKYSESRCGK